MFKYKKSLWWEAFCNVWSNLLTVNFATVLLFLDDKVPFLSLSRGGLWQEHGYHITDSMWQSNVSELTLDDKVYDPAS